ncbi:MAG: adenylate/guanylate cyclase domain-containing protein [Acidimicrobiia bacterium]|nr:adenylate/guanylate cyclase domain-containing protein [Acidimicrobiia bacterium]
MQRVTQDLRRFLADAGASEDDIERAAREGWLPLLAIDRILMPGKPVYDIVELARAAGTDTETARRVWRSLGFPDMPEGVASFTDQDAEMLSVAVARIDTEDAAQLFERQVRVISSSLARIAAVEADMIAEVLETIEEETGDAAATTAVLLERLDWPVISRLVEYAHRLQLRAAVWRRLARDVAGAKVEIGIGFVDLVGYTALSEEIDDRSLAELLTRFEALASDVVAEHSGRVVKTIGDEVMFAALSKEAALIALDIVDRASDDTALPPVRAGVASGPLIARDGDFYGSAVNLASRVTDRARPGTVLVSESLKESLEGDAAFSWRSAGRRRLRGIGEVELFRVRRAGGEPSGRPGLG